MASVHSDLHVFADGALEKEAQTWRWMDLVYKNSMLLLVG